MRAVRDEVVQLFAAVSEAIARSTAALLEGDVGLAQAVVADEQAINRRAADAEAQAWAVVDRGTATPAEVRTLVSVLLMVPELERSADLAEHVANRALAGLGAEMSPATRGIVERMGEVAVELWQEAAGAFGRGAASGADLEEADDELDILHERLTAEVARGGMDPTISAQVTLLGRFYERLGDHAVNLARRIETMPPGG
ncbi:MAG TPA: PhoU domain-containing protein [Acidimicrobiales bacterium]|nr:PhoU domain-containing protein [Acidimicrobiales bacterium]